MRTRSVRKDQGGDVKVQKRSVKVEGRVVKGRVVVVVDDLVGTGAGLEGVGRVCEEGGARGVYCYGVCVLADEKE